MIEICQPLDVGLDIPVSPSIQMGIARWDITPTTMVIYSTCSWKCTPQVCDILWDVLG